MDGLLIDSERVTFEILAETGQKNGYTMTRELYVQLLGITNEKAGELLKVVYGDDFDYKSYFGNLHELMVERYNKEGVPVKPGAFELLEQLENDNKKCIVASSSNADWVHTMMKMTGLGRYFKDSICGDEVKTAKPDPEIFLSACRKLGVQPCEAVVLEDSFNGVLAANRADIKALCIPDMTVPDGTQLDIYRYFNDLYEVKTFFEVNNYEI